MLYLIGQIVLCLMFAFVIGATVGWLLRGIGTSAQTETVEARWRARLSQLQQAQRSATPPASSNQAAAAAAKQEIVTLRRQVQERDAALEASAKQLLSAAGDNSAGLTDQAEQTAQINTRLQGYLAEQKAVANQLQGQLSRMTEEQKVLVERLRDRESEIGRMSQERQHAINTIASLQKELRALRGHAQRQTDEKPLTAAPAVEKRLQERNGPDSKQAPGHEPVAPDDASAESGTQQALPMRDGAATTSVAAYKPDWILAGPNGPKDNLQAIYGIGPKLEMQLNRLGIFHFEQIAGFGDKDILWVARHLKSFPGRIVRDQWIQQARTLAQRKGV